MQITVDCAIETGKLDHFWQSTGFTPASLLLNADMRQAMAYVGSVPHGGVTYVRIHYLLELVTAQGLGTESPQYDWSALDTALDVLVDNGLVPFFELMGNPSGYFTDYTDETQAWAWRRLVRDLAQHYVARYGLNEVRRWYFETWNEPDIGWWRQSEEAFCAYYDACSAGLRDTDPELRMGGPGTCRGLSSMLTTFLAHCDGGTDCFTGEAPTPPAFVSVHEKGVHSSPEDLNPDSLSITEREAAIVAYIHENHPHLADVPFMNNECDPQVGWLNVHTWRARPYYAAIACKIVHQHLVRLVDELGVPYVLLSNDNGFLGTWGNRTLLARFGHIQELRAQAEHRTQPSDLQENPERRAFEMVKKPIYNAMVLLSLLGDTCCAVEGAGDGSGDIGAIATRRGEDQVAVLVYHSRDRIMSSGQAQVELGMEGLPFGPTQEVMLAHYRIDEQHGDPFAVWEAQGAPRHPSDALYAEMRRHQELALLEEPHEVAIHDGKLELELELPLPAVSLILLSARPAEGPGAAQGLRSMPYEGLMERKEVLLRWQGLDSRTLCSYEVLYSPSAGGPFTRVNEADLLCTAYLHVSPPGTGYYQVRAVDYWSRRGPTSPAIEVA
jgi:L-iduronidase